LSTEKVTELCENTHGAELQREKASTLYNRKKPTTED